MKKTNRVTMRDRGRTLCWDCKNALGYECEWMNDEIPVDGWTAIPTSIHTNNRDNTNSYNVIECPKFIPDKPRRKK